MARNTALESSKFWATVRALETALVKIQSEDRSTSQDGVRWFMSAIYEAGRALQLHPEWATQPTWRNFIEASAPILAERILEFSRFYQDSTDVLARGWEFGEEWIGVCRDWSSAQFVRELYGDTLEQPFHYFSEDDEYLDNLRAQGEKHGPLRPQDIPEGIPPSHWWWWYPDPPRNVRAS